jgi:hypothetical protein
VLLLLLFTVPPEILHTSLVSLVPLSYLLLPPIIISIMLAGARGIQWAASPADNSVLYACSRGTLSLPWTLLLAAGDVIEDVKWFFSGRSQEIMAADMNGVFVSLPAYSGRVSKTTNAGLDVSHVQQLDSGNCSVEVLARTAAGDVVTLWRSAYVHVTGVYRLDHVIEDNY